ncbi:MAG TPA: hypothetical protein VN151_03520 [Terracidiphilus sp.]|jgi:hypothetical protein|nr:hypothetical protein [Terracidiphilus sp.]
MTQDTYRFAYEEANAELREILEQFEQLRLRKTQMELVIEALRPMLSDAPAAAIAAEVQPAEVAPFLVSESQETIDEPAPAVEAFEEPELVAETADPFQRRIDNALRQGFGGRDSRVLSLGLNGLLTRA